RNAFTGNARSTRALIAANGDLRAAVVELHHARAGGGALVVNQGSAAGEGKAYDIFRVETEHTFSIEGRGFNGDGVPVAGDLREGKTRRLAPLRGLILKLDFIADSNAILAGDDAEMVFTGSEFHHPAQAGGGKILAITLPRAGGCAVQEEFGRGAVRIDLHDARLALRTPAHRPGVAVDVRHGLLGPVGLEDEVAFLLRHVALDDTFLVYARHGILDTQGRGEILEGPLRRSSEPG